MNKRILVITDKIECHWPDEAIKDDNKSCHYDILSLGLHKEANSYLNKDRFNRIGSFEFIDINMVTESIQENIRKYVLSLIYEFPRKEFIPGLTIMRLLSRPKFNLWWFMEISEKTIRTPLIKRIYYFEIIRNTILKEDYQELWLELQDKEILNLVNRNRKKLPRIKLISTPHLIRPIQINEFIKNLFWIKLLHNMLRTQFSCFLRYIIIKVAGFEKNRKIEEKSFLFFSFFPYFWDKSPKSGMTEIFYKTLPDKIKTWTPAYYSVWLLTLGPFKLWKDRYSIREYFKQKDITALEAHLTLKDFISVAFFSLKYIFTLIKYYFNLLPAIRERYQGYDITNIITAELNQSLVSLTVSNCILLMKASRNITKNNKINTLIYRIEFQAHEKAILYGVDGNCATVAFQHHAFSRDHIQYFFNIGEIPGYYLEKTNPQNMPLPNKYLVTGEYAFRAFKDNGFPENDINICGPLRYSELIAYIKHRGTKAEVRNKYGLSEKEPIFLLAFSYQKEDAINLTVSLLQAIKNINNNLLFLIRSHPYFKFNREITNIINRIHPALRYKILSDNINLNDYLMLSNALILTPSTLGIEAICLGTLPILFENNATFSINHLLEIKRACLCVKTPQELKQAILSVINNGEEIKGISKFWPSAIKETFYSIEDDPIYKFNNFLKTYAESL